VTTTNDQRLELGLERRFCAAGGVSELTEESADVGIALADASRFALPGRLVVARTEANPGGQAVRGAEDAHVAADLHQQHGGADEIDARQGLQQGERIVLARQFGEQAGVETGDARFEFLDMPQQFVKNEHVTRGQFALQGIVQFLAAGFETSTGELKNLMRSLPPENPLDHRACRLTMDIADHYAQPDAGIGQHFVHAVLLGREQPDELLPLPGDQTQFAQLGRRHERPSEQTGSRQGGQPLGISDIRLASRHLLDVTGIDHRRPDTDRLQRRIRTLPVDARAFHDDFVRIKRRRPDRQLPPVAFERAKLPLLDSCLATRFLDDRARRDLGLMNIQPNDPLVDRNQFHTVSFRHKLEGGRRWVPEPILPEGDGSPTALLMCALDGSNPGYESVQRVTLACGVKPPKYCATSTRRFPTRIFFHHPGRRQPQ
jgi:hypothetical protein